MFARTVAFSHGWNAGSILIRIMTLLALLWLAVMMPARAEQNDLFTVSGIAVDVQAQDALQAKMQAILQAQRRAFLQLVQRLAGKRAAERLSRLSDRDIGRLMSSLSITDERTGANRYIATLAFRFNPRKVVNLLRKRGFSVVTVQAPPVLVIPVWEDLDGIRIFEDNPWLRAWRKVADEHALQPVIVPAGDAIDRDGLDPVAIRDGMPEALQPFALRYGVEHVLVAFARPLGEGRVQAAMVGKAPGGKVAFDKEYEAPAEAGADAQAENAQAENATPFDAAALQAARRFHEVLTEKWRRKQIAKARAAAEAARARAAAEAARRRAAAAMKVIVPFRSLREWQSLRARLSTNPAIAAVDVQALSGNHAVVHLVPRVARSKLAAELARSGLDLRHTGGQWYLRAY